MSMRWWRLPRSAEHEMALHEAEVISAEAAESVAAARILKRAQAASADNALTNK
jgi:hypothetical protein